MRGRQLNVGAVVQTDCAWVFSRPTLLFAGRERRRLALPPADAGAGAFGRLCMYRSGACREGATNGREPRSPDGLRVAHAALSPPVVGS